MWAVGLGKNRPKKARRPTSGPPFGRVDGRSNTTSVAPSGLLGGWPLETSGEVDGAAHTFVRRWLDVPHGEGPDMKWMSFLMCCIATRGSWHRYERSILTTSNKKLRSGLLGFL